MLYIYLEAGLWCFFGLECSSWIFDGANFFSASGLRHSLHDHHKVVIPGNQLPQNPSYCPVNLLFFSDLLIWLSEEKNVTFIKPSLISLNILFCSSSFFFFPWKKILLYYLLFYGYGCLPAWIYVHCICTWYPQKPEESIRSPGTGYKWWWVAMWV